MTNEVYNRNHNSPLKFSFSVEKLPNVNFFVQEVNVPGLSINKIDTGTPFVKIPVPSEKMTFSDLQVTFLVDEDYENWYEIFRWMEGIAFPETMKQYKTVRDGTDKDLHGKTLPQNRPKGFLNHIHSDANLILRTSHNNSTIELEFKDCWPAGLTDLTFSTTQTEDNPLTATVTLAYTRYTVKKA